MVDKKLHKKLKNREHEPHKETRWAHVLRKSKQWHPVWYTCYKSGDKS